MGNNNQWLAAMAASARQAGRGNKGAKAILQARLARAFKKRNLYIASQACAGHGHNLRLAKLSLMGWQLASAWRRLAALKAAQAQALALIRPSFDIYAIITEAKFAGNRPLMLGAQALLAQHLAKHGHSCIAFKGGA